MNDRAVEAVGGFLVTVGVLGALAPALLAGWPLSTAAVLAVGVLATGFAFRAARRRRRTRCEYVDVPLSGAVPEDVREPREFGGDVAADLADAAPTRHRSQRAALRDRLRGDVVDALAARGYSQADARAAVDDGSWTDDGYAAAFLAPDLDRPVAERVRLALARDSLDRQVARVAAELAELTEDQ